MISDHLYKLYSRTIQHGVKYHPSEGSASCSVCASAGNMPSLRTLFPQRSTTFIDKRDGRPYPEKLGYRHEGHGKELQFDDDVSKIIARQRGSQTHSRLLMTGQNHASAYFPIEILEVIAENLYERCLCGICASLNVTCKASQQETTAIIIGLWFTIMDCGDRESWEEFQNFQAERYVE